MPRRPGSMSSLVDHRTVDPVLEEALSKQSRTAFNWTRNIVNVLNSPAYYQLCLYLAKYMRGKWDKLAHKRNWEAMNAHEKYQTLTTAGICQEFDPEARKAWNTGLDHVDEAEETLILNTREASQLVNPIIEQQGNATSEEITAQAAQESPSNGLEDEDILKGCLPANWEQRIETGRRSEIAALLREKIDEGLKMGQIQNYFAKNKALPECDNVTGLIAWRIRNRLSDLPNPVASAQASRQQAEERYQELETLMKARIQADYPNINADQQEAIKNEWLKSVKKDYTDARGHLTKQAYSEVKVLQPLPNYENAANKILNADKPTQGGEVHPSATRLDKAGIVESASAASETKQAAPATTSSSQTQSRETKTAVTSEAGKQEFLAGLRAAGASTQTVASAEFTANMLPDTPQAIIKAATSEAAAPMPDVTALSDVETTTAASFLERLK